MLHYLISEQSSYRMRKLITFFSVCFFSTLLLFIAIVILAIDAHPRVDRQVILTPADIERAKQIFDAHNNPLTTNQFSIANIQPKNADIVANYLVNHFTKGSAKISVANQKADIFFSFPVPQNRVLNGYLNFQATLIQTAALPQLQSVHIGNLVLPDFLKNFLVLQLINWLQNHPNLHQGLNAIKLVEISPQKISITYRRWNNSSLVQGIFTPLLSKKAQVQIYRYHEQLVNKSKQVSTKTTTLSEILLSLMQFAEKYSTHGDALAENRALILATTLHILEMPIEMLIPGAAEWPRVDGLSVTLEGRADFAKHFVASAAIAAYADTTLSNAVGLYKEIADSQHGRGFSFSDIVADHAGSRFGQKAVENQESALRLQQLVAAGLNDADLMPPWSDLPEHMTEIEFKTRFGSINTITYQKVMRDIENRILKLRILR